MREFLLGSLRRFFWMLLCSASFAVSAAEPPPEPIKVHEADGKWHVCWADTAAAVRFDSVEDLVVAFASERQWRTSKVDVEPWSACSQARCYGSEAEVLEACGAPAPWVVAPYALDSRPIYEATDPAAKKKGREIARTGKPRQASCEGELDPPWPSISNWQWQYTTSPDGVLGLALCAPR